jgi:hypothetical protein
VRRPRESGGPEATARRSPSNPADRFAVGSKGSIATRSNELLPAFVGKATFPQSRVWLVALALPVVAGSPAVAAERSPEEPVAFAIPAEGLPQALDAFSAATGIEVLVDARNAEGRQSPGVRGVMTPRAALSILLSGAPLVAQEFSPGTVTLMTAGEGPRAQPEAGAAPASDPAYFALIQRAVFRALCGDAATAPGSYRLALKLRIDPSGIVSRGTLLGTTGDVDRDWALGTILPGLDIGAPPPADLAQPVAVLVLPRTPDMDCPAAAPAVRRASNWPAPQGGRDQ